MYIYIYIYIYIAMKKKLENLKNFHCFLIRNSNSGRKKKHILTKIFIRPLL